MPSERLPLVLARISLEATRDRARRKMQGTLDHKARGIMESRNMTDADLDRLVVDPKVLRGIERDMKGGE